VLHASQRLPGTGQQAAKEVGRDPPTRPSGHGRGQGLGCSLSPGNQRQSLGESVGAPPAELCLDVSDHRGDELPVRVALGPRARVVAHQGIGRAGAPLEPRGRPARIVVVSVAGDALPRPRDRHRLGIGGAHGVGGELGGAQIDPDHAVGHSRWTLRRQNNQGDSCDRLDRRPGIEHQSATRRQDVRGHLHDQFARATGRQDEGLSCGDGRDRAILWPPRDRHPLGGEALD